MTVAELPRSSWVDDLRKKNPLDHLGRSASSLASIRTAGTPAGQMLCPECHEPFRLCVGDNVSPYFSHQCSDAEHACPGSYETVWHIAAKRAASRLFGWSDEKPYEVGGRRFKADAMHMESGHVFEAVHTLSRDYPTKHIATKQSGRVVSWLFDGNAPFCRPLPEGPWGVSKKVLAKFDSDYAERGQLVAKGLLRRKARELVYEIGVDSCFLHFAGFAFRCFQCGPDTEDMWCFCDGTTFVGRVVYGQGGLNARLIHARAAGEEVTCHGLGTIDTPDHEELLGDVVKNAWLIAFRRNEMRRCHSLDSRDADSSKPSRWVAPEDWPGDLVNLMTPCRCGSRFGVDVPIHSDQSTRRDCAQCNRFIGFTKWHGLAVAGNANNFAG